MVCKLIHFLNDVTEFLIFFSAHYLVVMHCLVFWLLFWSTLLLTSARVCPSVDIRNSVDHLGLLQGCSVVEGYVRIVLMERTQEADFELLTLPDLREVTQYLLFYKVVGLRSLGLTVIRGDTLFQDFALVVYEMFSLEEIGLRSLVRVDRGAVRIEKNPSKYQETHSLLLFWKVARLVDVGCSDETPCVRFGLFTRCCFDGLAIIKDNRPTWI